MKRIDWGRLAADVAADWIARVIYFLGTVFCMVFGAPYSTGHFDLWLSPEFWVFAAFLGMLAAAFGPAMYRSKRNRGLGKLDEIRRHSRMGVREDVSFASPAEERRRSEDEHV